MAWKNLQIYWLNKPANCFSLHFLCCFKLAFQFIIWINNLQEDSYVSFWGIFACEECISFNIMYACILTPEFGTEYRCLSLQWYVLPCTLIRPHKEAAPNSRCCTQQFYDVSEMASAAVTFRVVIFQMHGLGSLVSISLMSRSHSVY